MTSQIPEDPLFIERVPGGNLINAFEDMLLTYNINPVFAHKVVARKQVNGAYFIDGYFAFEKKHRLDVEYILFSLLSIIDEFSA